MVALTAAFTPVATAFAVARAACAAALAAFAVACAVFCAAFAACWVVLIAALEVRSAVLTVFCVVLTGAILKKWTAKSERWYNNKKRRETHGKHQVYRGIQAKHSKLV